MLGRVIHSVTGSRAQDFITDNLLRPLAMDRTTWVRPYHDDWARPYDVVDDQRVRRHRAARRRGNCPDGWPVVVRLRSGSLGRLVRRRLPTPRRSRRRATVQGFAARDATGAPGLADRAHARGGRR